MNKLALLCLLFAAVSLHAQSVNSTGQFSAVVAGFAAVGPSGSTCQPGPGAAFPACALPAPSLGVAYSVTLSTVGPQKSVTCTLASGALPAGLTLSASGTSCLISGTPTSTGTSDFTVTFAGS